MGLWVLSGKRKISNREWARNEDGDEESEQEEETEGGRGGSTAACPVWFVLPPLRTF
jgi:hypothetical protein